MGVSQNKLQKRLRRLTGKAVEAYRMIEADDHVKRRLRDVTAARVQLDARVTVSIRSK